jgi:hypothetical protein
VEGYPPRAIINRHNRFEICTRLDLEEKAALSAGRTVTNCSNM